MLLFRLWVKLIIWLFLRLGGTVLVYPNSRVCAAAGWPHALAAVPEIATPLPSRRGRYNGGWPPGGAKASDGSVVVVHLLPLGSLNCQAGQWASGDSLVGSRAADDTVARSTSCGHFVSHHGSGCKWEWR